MKLQKIYAEVVEEEARNSIMKKLNTQTPYTIFNDNIEDEALTQFENCLNMEGCLQGALMADAHAGYTSPIGGVFKFKDRISPQIVGYDIGCGMCAVKLNMKASTLDKRAIFTEVYNIIPVGFTQHKEPQEVPNADGTSEIVQNHLNGKGKYQMGTLGGGNHFIELGEGQDGKLWVVIHSGSRNIGHAVAEHYMKLAAIQSVDYAEIDKEFEAKNESLKTHNPQRYQENLLKNRQKVKINLEGQHLFHIDSYEAKAYITDMNYCLEYALENRKKMIYKIVELLGNPKELEFINRNHNHAELKDGLWIHRKGATHAEKDMMGVIPGNMRDGSFIVKGKGNTDSLCSSSHGAGRVLSRTQAQKTLSLDEFKNEMTQVVAKVDAETLDESPFAYKNIFEVMELQKDLVEVVDHIKPLVNIKG